MLRVCILYLCFTTELLSRRESGLSDFLFNFVLMRSLIIEGACLRLPFQIEMINVLFEDCIVWNKNDSTL